MEKKKYSAYVGKEKLFEFEATDAQAAMKKAIRIHPGVTHVNGITLACPVVAPK